MIYLDSYSKFNEGWKNIVAGALIGLTTACQKPDLEDDFGRKIVHTNGNILVSKELKSLKGIKPQPNLVILKGQK